MQHYIGWSFFRQQPFFQFPFGTNTALGESLGSSVVFTDSIPLMAFLFKPFSSWLPTEFQYFGFWIIFCFILQSIFAWKILSRFVSGRMALALSTCFFVLSPVMLFRMLAHEALIGHWVILAAIYLYLLDSPKAARWAILIGVTCLIHAYLVVMVGAIWFADLFRRALLRKMCALHVLREMLGVLCVLALTTWTAGYFVEADPTQGMGFGLYRFNFIAPFSPMGIFSSWLPLYLMEGDYEGFAYLGIGMIGLAMVAFVGLLLSGTQRITHRSKFIVLAVLCLLFLAYAASNRIAWGSSLLWQYEVPEIMLPLTATFRASGRFAWPVIYLLQIGILVTVLTRFPKRIALSLVFGGLLMQSVELATASQFFRERWREPWMAPLASNFWPDAAQRYRRIARNEPKTDGPDPLTLLAAHYGMSINSGHLARVSQKRLDMVRQQMVQEVQSGSFRSDTLYVFDSEATWQQASNRAGSGALALAIDDQYILAPNWCMRHQHCDIEAYKRSIEISKPVTIDFRLNGSAMPFQGVGWSQPEKSGTWTDGNLAILHLPIQTAGGQSRHLRLWFTVFIEGKARAQHIAITANGNSVANWEFRPGNSVIARDITIPANALQGDHLTLEFRLPDAISPLHAGIGNDGRQLAMFMQSIDIMAFDNPNVQLSEQKAQTQSKR
jgi:hypothetical protein